MKKLSIMFLVLMAGVSITACGRNSSAGVSQKTESSSSANDNAVSTVEDDEVQNINLNEGNTVVIETQNESAAGEAGFESMISEENTFEEIIEADNMAVNSQTQASGSHILVAYFSRVGNTNWEDGVDVVTSASLNVVNGEYAGNAELLAQMAAQATGGDLFLIQTAETYPSDYRATTDQAKAEQSNNARPALSSHVDNMDAYDTIILVYPNWWGTLPQPLFTFLEEYDFSGKTILPICTHGGSRMGSSERDIANLCPDATLLSGLAVSGSGAASAQPEVEQWLNDLGILQ